MYQFFLFCLLFFLLSHSIDSDAEVDASNHLELDLISLYNPLGLSLSAKGFYRKVYRYDKSEIWDGLYYQTGFQINVNPAFSRAGFHFEVMPIAVLQLRLQYDRLQFSGQHGSLLSFSSSEDLFGDNELENREGDEESGYADRRLFQLIFRAQFANTIIRNVTDFSFYKFQGAGPYYLEREHEILMAADDDVVFNKLFLLFKTDFDDVRGSRYFGPYHEHMKVNQSGLIQERVGLTWFQEYNARLGILIKPRWYLQLGSYLKDQNREGEVYLIFGIGGDVAGL